MSDSEVFKHCLALFKLENNSLLNAGEETVPGNDRVENMFRKLSISFKESSFVDQFKVSQHVLNVCNRFLNKHLSETSPKSHGYKVLISCLHCIESCVITIWTNVEHRDEIHNLIIEQNSSVLIFMQIVSVFESVKDAMKSDISTTSQTSVEELTTNSLKTLQHLLNIFFYHLSVTVSFIGGATDGAASSDLVDKSRTYRAKFESRLCGPLLAQIVQSLLVFSSHINKTIASHALQCLLKILSELNSEKHLSDWRNFFPGIFSSLFALCSSSHKR
jgi:hypothetical protein